MDLDKDTHDVNDDVSQMGCCERIKALSGKLFVEFFGTFVLTLTFITNSSYGIIFAYWIMSIFVWKISKAQFNPAITVAYMFRNDGHKIHFSVGLLMMTAQCAGAYIAAMYMSFMFFATYWMGPSFDTGKYAWYCVWQEIIGTFVFVLLYKIVTDERLHFSKENSINMFVIAAIYQSSRQMVNGATAGISTYGACLNPAIAVGISLFSMLGNAGETFKWFWIYWFLPFAGSALALLFYRYVYVKTQNMVANSHDGKLADGEEEHLAEEEVDILAPKDDEVTAM